VLPFARGAFFSILRSLAPNDPGYPSAWSYRSWLPVQSSGAPAYLSSDKALGSSGVHVDSAWTYTIGRPDVRIAIADSGIEWDDPDLLNKAYLNAAELVGSHMPRDAHSNACGRSGSLHGYDCDGDDVFTAADYGRLGGCVESPTPAVPSTRLDAGGGACTLVLAGKGAGARPGGLVVVGLALRVARRRSRKALFTEGHSPNILRGPRRRGKKGASLPE
jgi:hypothetical protein